MIDWEMKARQLAENLETLAAVQVMCGALLMVAAEGKLMWLGAFLCAAGWIALDGAKIKP